MQVLGRVNYGGDALSVSLDAMTPEEVVPVVVADAVVASMYLGVDVIGVPCTVESPAKINKSYFANKPFYLTHKHSDNNQ